MVRGVVKGTLVLLLVSVVFSTVFTATEAHPLTVSMAQLGLNRLEDAASKFLELFWPYRDGDGDGLLNGIE
ncbi:MAG: hypothetical protein QXY80_03610, partial [Candidatus Jordarchaeales archaeon]